MGGNYQNNLFLESTSNSIIFNTGGYTSSSNPRMIINSSGNVGIGNPSPSAPLWIGRPDVPSTGYLVISQNASGNRNFKMGYDSTFNFAFGDYGYTNGTNTWTEQFWINYSAPANSLVILSNGYVGMGTNNPLTFLDVRGVLYLGGNSGLGTPTSNWGNAGTRIVFWNDTTDVSYSMGMNGATLWYAVPNSCIHLFYVGTTSIATINGSGLSVSGTLTTPQFYTSSTNNIVTNVITIYPTSTSGGPYGNGYWLINVSNYTSQSGFTYLFFNISVPVVPIYWLGRVAISSGGSASYYPDMAYNVQLSFSSGNIQVSSPSGASFSLALYYRIMG